MTRYRRSFVVAHGTIANIAGPIIEASNTYFILTSGPLYVTDITLFDVVSDRDISYNDLHVYRTPTDIGLFCEFVSTVYPWRPDQDIDYWVNQRGRQKTRDIYMQGLRDPGLNSDIAANKLGAKFGIRAYHNPLELPRQP